MRNKSFLMTGAMIIIALSSFAQETGSFIDDRDSTNIIIYRTVKIGKQTWMAENLNYDTYNHIILWQDYRNWCYNDSCNKYEKLYGRLYDWNTAQNVCPSGWHLPSKADWDTLSNNLNGNKAKKLKSKITWRLQHDSATNNSSGFTALPGGYCDNSRNFKNLGIGGYWWSKDFSENIIRIGSTETTKKGWGFCILDNSVGTQNDDISAFYSIRCLKDTLK